MINWDKRLERAKERGGFFTKTDKERASNWHTCPVGKRMAFMDDPRTQLELGMWLWNNYPHMLILGEMFSTHVRDNEIEKAVTTFGKIGRMKVA